MLGTIVNALAILVGGGIGLLLKGGLKEKYRTMLNAAMGLSVLFVGLSSALTHMMDPGAHPLLYIIALALGGIVGEWVGIEAALEKLGSLLQAKIKTGGQSNISKGFVAASLLFCVGTMAVLGSLESGTQGRHTILFAKSLLDGIIALAMASALGLGVLFSSVSVLVYQGTLTLLAVWVSPYLTADMLREISIIGGIIIVAIGLNMLEITKIRVGNLLPALVVPVFYYLALALW